MLYRRHLLTFSAGLACAGLAPWRAQARDTAANAIHFLRTTGDELVGVINGNATPAQKRAALTRIIDRTVDVGAIARFCLGRFWRQASAEQKRRYVALFHEVLVTSITAKLGEYQGVRFTVGRAVPDGSNEKVATVVDRPNNPSVKVEWVVANPATDPKIIDVIAEGASLRLTQRSDYTSYLTHNHDSIEALLSALRRQVAQNHAAG